jgi:predicted kinase
MNRLGCWRARRSVATRSREEWPTEPTVHDPTPGDVLTQRALAVFFELLHLLPERGVTVVAEAARQDEVWRADLAPLTALGSLRLVQCHTDPATAWQRISARATSRSAHADHALLQVFASGDRYFEQFRRLTIAAPTMDVDTTAGYNPTIEQVVAFITTT